jgi:hypothetical protein
MLCQELLLLLQHRGAGSCLLLLLHHELLLRLHVVVRLLLVVHLLLLQCLHPAHVLPLLPPSAQLRPMSQAAPVVPATRHPHVPSRLHVPHRHMRHVHRCRPNPPA